MNDEAPFPLDKRARRDDGRMTLLVIKGFAVEVETGLGRVKLRSGDVFPAFFPLVKFDSMVFRPDPREGDDSVFFGAPRGCVGVEILNSSSLDKLSVGASLTITEAVLSNGDEKPSWIWS